jgi:hypothetical protein
MLTKAFKVSATGTQVTTSGTSSATAIPNDGNGTKAKWVRLQALATCYVRPGFSGTTAVVGDILLSTGEALILDVQGFTHIAAIQETASAKFNITPLDNAP